MIVPICELLISICTVYMNTNILYEKDSEESHKFVLKPVSQSFCIAIVIPIVSTACTS